MPRSRSHAVFGSAACRPPGPRMSRSAPRAKIQAEHEARVNIQNQRQPRSPDADPRHIVDQHEIDLGVVDLDHLQRPLRPQA